MKYYVAFGSLVSGFLVEASTVNHRDLGTLFPRASADAPSGYTPATVDCPPDRPTVRNASSISSPEQSWLRSRRPNTVQPMRDLLGRINIPGFDAYSYISSHSSNVSQLPNIGIAASGGGYRALMNGAGALAAFDSRTPGATSSGQLGGLLQSSTYLAGLSGGSWLVGSLYANNFTSIQTIIDNHNRTWDFSNSIFQGPPQGLPVIRTSDYYENIHDDVGDKGDAFNFETSITDFWGRALSYQLVNASQGGPGVTFSSVANQDFFSSGQAPLPILVADERAPGQLTVPSNTTVYEFNPWEMGSWDPTLQAFVPLKYVGSNFTGGQLPRDQQCVAGFDNIGYVMGTSSTLFNQFFLMFNQTVSFAKAIQDPIQRALNNIGNNDNDIALYKPNPFSGYNPGTNANANSDTLTLVDGGEDFQNIPLNPLIQPPRAVDVIFAIDSSADTDQNWPNGTSLVATYQRSQNLSIENGTPFPTIPPQQTFINLGLNNQPVFFGCNASNFTSPGQAPGPIIVYLPNSPYAYNSNLTTFDPEYNSSERDAVITNGYDVATRANASVDANWPVCVGCAILSRSLDRNNAPLPQACQQCFSRYCWNGTLDNSPIPYDPSAKLAQIQLGAASGLASPRMASLALGVAVTALSMLV